MKQINYLIRIRNTLKLAFPPHTECGERQTISVMTGGTLLKTVFNLTSQGQWAPTTVSGSGWKLCAFPKDGGRVAWQLNISNIATRAKTFPWKKRLILKFCMIFDWVNFNTLSADVWKSAKGQIMSECILWNHRFSKIYSDIIWPLMVRQDFKLLHFLKLDSRSPS